MVAVRKDLAEALRCKPDFAPTLHKVADCWRESARRADRFEAGSSGQRTPRSCASQPQFPRASAELESRWIEMVGLIDDGG